MIDINNIVTAATPILVTVITGVLTWVGTKANKLIKAKISTENYTKLKNVGQNAWYIVEEYFRLHPELKTSIESKAIMFATEVRKKIPYVTDAELETLRQAIAGEINKDKPVSSSTSATVYDSPIQDATVAENATVTAVTDTATVSSEDSTNAKAATSSALTQDEIKLLMSILEKNGVDIKSTDPGATA